MHAEPPIPPIGWALYDASCGICARGVPWWSSTFSRLGLATAALQEPWVAKRTGLTTKALMRDFCILLSDGSLLRGTDAYRWILRQRWWSLPLWLLVAIPPGRWAFDLGYRIFANHRQRVSRLCGLTPHPRAGSAWR